MATPDWSIIESRGRPGLERLEADWRRLYAAMPLRTSFLAYEACLAHVDHYMTAPDQLRCLALTDGRQVRAICLLEPRTTRVRVWGVLWQWHARQANVLCPDDEAQRELVPALVAHLRRTPEGRRLLILGPAPTSSTLWEGLQRLGRGGYHVDLRESVHLLDCSMPFDELRASLDTKFRCNLNNAAHRLAKLDHVRFLTAPETGDLDSEFATFLEIEASGWKGEGGTRSAIRCSAAMSAFFHDLAANLRGDADYCEIVALYAEGHCLASQFCTRTGATYSTLKTGHDEAYRRVSPGQLLVEKTVERCCQDPGIERFDMVSDAPWIRGWRPSQVRLQVAYVVVARWPAYPIIAALLQLRFGPWRRCARWLRSSRAPRSRGREESGPGDGGRQTLS